MADGVRIDQFDINDTEDIGNRWNKWIKRLERLFTMKNDTESNVKINKLFLYGGSDLEEVYEKIKANNDDYTAIAAKLKAHFNPQTNVQLHIFNFREIEQYEDEPFDDFVARLSGKANFCNFENTETEILNQIIQKCSSDDLKKKALETGNLTLKNLIELGRLQESVATQIKELSRGSTRSKDINHISSSTRHHTNEAKTVTFSDKNFINSDKVYEKSNRVKRNYGERKIS